MLLGGTFPLSLYKTFLSSVPDSTYCTWLRMLPTLSLSLRTNTLMNKMMHNSTNLHLLFWWRLLASEDLKLGAAIPSTSTNPKTLPQKHMQLIYFISDCSCQHTACLSHWHYVSHNFKNSYVTIVRNGTWNIWHTVNKTIVLFTNYMYKKHWGSLRSIGDFEKYIICGTIFKSAIWICIIREVLCVSLGSMVG